MKTKSKYILDKQEKRYIKSRLKRNKNISFDLYVNSNNFTPYFIKLKNGWKHQLYSKNGRKIYRTSDYFKSEFYMIVFLENAVRKK